MTREEIYTSIYTHDVIYRPPQEESCACLEVALGCSWGKCLFCDFAKDHFQIHGKNRMESADARQAGAGKNKAVPAGRKCLCAEL